MNAIPASFPDSARIKRTVPWLIACALFMEMLDISILNTAVPSMAYTLKVNPLSLKSALTSYTLSLAVFIPLSGWIADRLGTQRVFCGAISIFTVGSLLCGLATNVDWLIGARILQGLGGALMVPVGRNVLVRTFSKSEILRVMSFITIPALIGPVVGPLLGGLITHYLHWRFIFFINIPVGLVSFYFARQYLPNYHSEKRIPMDWIGFFLFGSGLTCLSYALELLGEHGLSMSEVIILFTFSLILLSFYILYALRQHHPLLNIRLFRTRTFNIAVTGGFVTRLGLGGLPFIFPLLYQIGFNRSPIESGLLIMPLTLGALSMKTLAPRFLQKFGYLSILSTNTIGIGIILCTFSLITPSTPMWIILILMGILGLCSSLQYTGLNTLTYADILNQEASQATSIASTVQQLSTSFGVATAAVLISLFLPTAHPSHVKQSVLFMAFNKTFLILGLLSVASSLIFRCLHKEDGNNIR